MIPKKTNKADLESKRGIFLQIGLIITLGVILAAFEWSSSSSQMKSFEISDGVGLEEEIIPITRQKEIKPPPPPKLKVIEFINIVDDDDLIEDDPFIGDVEADQNMEIDINPYIDDEEPVEDELFIIVEDMPRFQGGELEQFRMWVMKNLNYPEIAAENGVSGKVYVQFVVNTKGQVEDAVIFKGVDLALNQESIRVVMSSPKWVPGKQRGKTVRVQYILPINFVLQ